MKNNTLTQIRKEFIDFFKSCEHKEIPSSTLVPINDDSLLFTNAGMVQFKNIFTGLESPPEKKRAVTAQKCVRAGGKHNDLENVGLTKRHHTFFEMLGNFSFGDYFKEEAIELAWKLITKNFQINKDKIIITVYEKDEQAFNLWKKTSSISESRILKINSNDNFWEMGDTGPCGPCSEIFYDHGSNYQGGLPGSNNEGERYVEIWNLVFMQYNKFKNGKKEYLPKPSIDTGMGIERVAAVLQGKADNYEIDLFRNLIEKIKDVLNIKETEKSKIPLRIISDHLRSVSFLIADGVLPSNEGRGYVLRRILRRAIRHIYNLKIKEPVFFKLVPIIIEEMGTHYNDLITYKELISKTIKIEETKFFETLDKGLKILEEENRKTESKKIFSGKVAFKLYDTYGFPLDLTEDVLKSSKKSINIEEFNEEMMHQKKLSKKSWKGEVDDGEQENLKKIFRNMNRTFFSGYDHLAISSSISKIIFRGSSKRKFSIQDEKVSIFLKETTFYAEGGGQIGDVGIIENEDFLLEVVDTQKKIDKFYEHICIIKRGSVSVGDKAFLKVNKEKRSKITVNHSATHLLHSALRRTLGNHVTQKGSLVNDRKVRFDISHDKPITLDLIRKLELLINEQIQGNYPVVKNILEKNHAIEKGAMAIFGEKYEERVRVIEMGIDKKLTTKPFSIELCGGTHVKSTGEIGTFKIINEFSLGSGIRRLEAITGKHAVEFNQDKEYKIKSIANLLKTSESMLIQKIEGLLREKKELEKRISKKDSLSEGSNNLNKTSLENYNIYTGIFNEVKQDKLKSVIDVYKNKDCKSIIILISKNKKKVTVVIGVAEQASKKLDAIDLIHKITPIIGGTGGGGRKTLAQGGGTNNNNINKSLDHLINYIKKKLAI